MTITSTAPALRLQGVSKSFGTAGQRRWPPWASASARPARVVKTAVHNISLDVRRGEIVGVLGANGSGKSTLIRLVATLLIADSGSISVFGLDVQRDEQAAKRLINRVSVDAAFFKKLSPMENLIYAARLYGLRAGPAQVHAFEILERLGISRRTALSPMEHMSRGMQQKVAIARALLTAPTLLLLDEPTTGLDPRSKKDVQAFVEEIRATHDATVVLTTHDMGEADRLCDRVAVLSQGRIIALDTPTNLKTTVGANASLEDVFLELTGSALDEEDGEAAA